MKKKTVSRSSYSDKSQYEVHKSKEPKNSHSYRKPEEFSPSPISSNKSFSCEDLLLVGSFSQIKRQRRSTSVHTLSSTSDDQLSQTLSGDDDDDNSNIYASAVNDIDSASAHEHIRKPSLRAKVKFPFMCNSLNVLPL